MACLLWLFLVWWFIELIGCDDDVLASFPLILFSSSYRPRWVLGPLWGLGRVELYIVAHSKSVWRVQLDGITRYDRSCQKFWTEAKFLTHQKVLRAVSLCLKPIGMTALKPKVKKHRVAGLYPTHCIDVRPCSSSSVCVDLLQWIRFVLRVVPKVKKKSFISELWGGIDEQFWSMFTEEYILFINNAVNRTHNWISRDVITTCFSYFAINAELFEIDSTHVVFMFQITAKELIPCV